MIRTDRRREATRLVRSASRHRAPFGTYFAATPSFLAYREGDARCACRALVRLELAAAVTGATRGRTPLFVRPIGGRRVHAPPALQGHRGIRSLRHLVPSRLPCRVTSTSSTVMRTTGLRSLPIASGKYLLITESPARRPCSLSLPARMGRQHLPPHPRWMRWTVSLNPFRFCRSFAFPPHTKCLQLTNVRRQRMTARSQASSPGSSRTSTS